ncbi:MAG TPA: hypothetical protein VNZ52_02555 [Candidatus Thermoplasmatota archaeon]|nr:hypothetical protein [Candidatus Thermoplasmatota archaeon]
MTETPVPPSLPRKRTKLDPETERLLEESLERNREILEALAKL